jgi:hypothetical protein
LRAKRLKGFEGKKTQGFLGQKDSRVLRAKILKGFEGKKTQGF